VAPTDRPVQEVPMLEMMMNGLAQPGPAQMESGAIPVRDKPAHVEVVAADASSGTKGIQEMRQSLGPRT
jgi:hypothetical protein